MKKNLYRFIRFITEPIILVPLISIVLMVITSMYLSKKNKQENEAIQKMINACLERPDRKVETVGSVWARQYLVCNPK